MMLNTVSKLTNLRNGASAATNRFLSFTATLKSSDDDSEWSGGGDGDAKNKKPPVATNLKVIFETSLTNVEEAGDDVLMGGDATTNDGATSQSSRRRMKILFEKSADALNLTRYKNFPLPGDVTMGVEYRRLILPAHSKTHSATVQLEKTPSLADDQLRQIETVRQFGVMNRYRRKALDTTTTAQQALRCLDRVRCAAHECPMLVRKDFMDTFPDSNINNEQNLTVITITEKPSTSSAMLAKNDSDFSDTIHASQSVFSNVAEEICNFVRASGFWADFVDPFSGKLFSGDFASPTDLAGTELALNRFSGLSVENAGSCTVISRRRRFSTTVNDDKIIEPIENLSSPSVVGLIFTAASVDSPVVQFLLRYAAKLDRDDIKSDVKKANFNETADRKINSGVLKIATKIM